jgi:hypothetical protein
MSIAKTELTGIITLKSLFSKERKVHAQPAKDKRTNWYKGVARVSEDEKKKLSNWVDPEVTLLITHNMQLDLNDKRDKLNWDWLQHLPDIADSFEAAQMSRTALFYVDNVSREAKKSIAKDELVFNAMRYVMDDKPSNYATRARLLGFNMEGEDAIVIKEFLLKLAKDIKNSAKVISAYESNETTVHLIFIKATDKDVIKLTNGAYMFGNVVLGITVDSVLSFLKDPTNRVVLDELHKELNPEDYLDKDAIAAKDAKAKK